MVRRAQLLRTIALVVVASASLAAQAPPNSGAGDNGSMVQREVDIARPEAGPHNGGGQTVGHSFFAGSPGLKLVFRKRVFKPGSGIGPHRQNEDEIYYVISGRGALTLDGKVFDVGPGTGILTRVGSTHALKQVGKEDLVIIINYEVPPPAAR